ncbi:MAG: hypothetical protein ACTILB_15280 [Brevibacterium aurantiacum]
MTTTLSLTRAATRAADLFAGLNRDQVLNHLNIEEADIIANLFEALGHQDIATHVRIETWHAEDTTDRDPLPWVTPNGTRHNNNADPSDNDTFQPRPFTEWCTTP